VRLLVLTSYPSMPTYLSGLVDSDMEVMISWSVLSFILLPYCLSYLAFSISHSSALAVV